MKKWLVSLIILILIQCQDDFRKAVKKSLHPEADFVLQTFPNNLIDSAEEGTEKTVHYERKVLENLRSDHNSAILEENIKNLLQSQPGNTIESKIKFTSHFTTYSYDSKIPIVFYGPDFFKIGKYFQNIDQQSIVLILKALLKINSSSDLKIKYPILKKVTKIPKLIVVIVIDQGGEIVLKNQNHRIPFLNSLASKSSYFPEASVSHIESHTAVGHAAIGTGQYPKEMNIFSNEFYFWKDGKVTKRSVFEPINNVWNVSELQSPTLADIWTQQNKTNMPVIVSHSYAPRASIGMAGHGGENFFVTWQDKVSGDWTTEPRFFRKSIALNELTGNKANTKNIPWYQFHATKDQVKWDVDSFLAVLDWELFRSNKIQDDITDLAFLNLKATDAAGHSYGWESIEMGEVLEETDSQVKRIFQFLQEKLGDNFVLVVTADHGAAFAPELSGGMVLKHSLFFEKLSYLLPEKVRKTESVIRWITHSQLSLNQDIMEKYRITKEDVRAAILSIKVNEKPFFRQVIPRSSFEE